MIIGTAGHIDHGKTALVRALTGIDTDRLKEERERGISIDLGFAHFDLDAKESAGVVDVPGHERFIRNMLAGAHGVDLVLLVVAADDGVMPQTEEHLDILHLLGVAHGIVAMTKIDLVDAARRAAVREEIAILLAGTALEGSPVHEVSSSTGEGIEELRAAIRERLRTLRRPAPLGCFRMPVDRAFLLHGHGLVVTGTAAAGTVSVHSTVRVLPGSQEARVRSIQVHGRSVERAGHGERVALNLAGIERGSIGRGHIVCDPVLERATSRFDAWVELRPLAKSLRHHARVRLYAGTAEAMGRVIWHDRRGALPARQAAYAQLVLPAPVALVGGQRFILRDHNARATIGGGVVLHPFAARLRRGESRAPLLERVRAATDPRERLTALVHLDAAFAVSPSDLAAAADLTVERVRESLGHAVGVRPLPDAARAEAYTSAEKWARLKAAGTEILAEFHRENPARPGMEMESLRSRLAPDLAPKVFRAVLGQLEAEGVLARDESIVRLPAHSAGISSADVVLARRIEEVLGQAALTPPDAGALAQQCGVTPQKLATLVAHLEREGRVARVAPDLLFSTAAVERARELVREHVAVHGEITAAAFRDRIGASRKFSIALLSYFDRTGFTLRVGDVRKLRR